MAQPSSLSSNNPFRRKGPGPSAPPSAAPSSPYQGATPSSPSASISALSSSTQFREQLQALPRPANPPPATSFQKPKVVKKVRVQSPPPSSPESAGVPDHYSRGGRDDDDDDDDESSSSGDDERLDPFSINPPARTAIDEDIEDSDSDDELTPPPPLALLHRVPPNPFQKTLQDLEHGAAETEQNNASLPGIRGTLDVNAFRRLLLTGQSGGQGAPQAAASTPTPAAASASAPSAVHLTIPAGDGASTTDTSSISRQSIFDATYPPVQDTPRTSHEISEPEADDDRHGLIGSSRPKVQTPTTLRKKPPPPSSRHGKLIKVELKSKDSPLPEGSTRPTSSSSLSSQTGRAPTSPLALPSAQEPSPLEINKPLPPAPQQAPPGDENDSIFDREAAGKVPEPEIEASAETLPAPRPPTPPNASHSTPNAVAASPTPKKPPPPPRRQPHGHARSDSKISIAVGHPPPSTSYGEDIETQLRRSSQDSTRSRSSSLRVSLQAPAPPPPRRPNHAPRGSNSFTSPSAVSFSSILSNSSDRSPSDAAELSPLPSQTPTQTMTAEPAQTVSVITSPDGPTPPPSHPAHIRLLPPPPPPARNASTRTKRPTSVSSLDVTSRRPSRGKEAIPLAPPPPPPSRQRGSSKGSMDGAGRKGSIDGVRILGVSETLAEEPGPVIGESAEDVSAAKDILADLTALQREVDALRGLVQQPDAEPKAG
ncbi:hypothetical protein B0T25DRAFT_286508 [Lasiosphaeria hispida]|uniref:Uncharacterized protein n=1 Tax=Lasiosphaeria hispida TaxID=260671 RepID=A0AAJ0MBC8_9PEZI|nr:hypothetical protein B0T25DRAFT_286508 [Lasiosphaeria hispida]